MGGDTKQPAPVDAPHRPDGSVARRSWLRHRDGFRSVGRRPDRRGRGAWPVVGPAFRRPVAGRATAPARRQRTADPEGGLPAAVERGRGDDDRLRPRLRPEALHRGARCAERLRRGHEAGEGRRRGDLRPSQEAGPRRAARRRRARDLPHQQPRRARHDDRLGHARQHRSRVGPVPPFALVRRRKAHLPERRTGADRVSRGGDPRSGPRAPYRPAPLLRLLATPRVPRRRLRGPLLALSGGTRLGPGEDCSAALIDAGGQSRPGPPLHRESPPALRYIGALLHPSVRRDADQDPEKHGRRGRLCGLRGGVPKGHGGRKPVPRGIGAGCREDRPGQERRRGA